AQILETEGGVDSIAEKIAQWGGGHGYDFTADEALAVRSGILAAAENNELADDELEMVAGGKGGSPSGPAPGPNGGTPFPEKVKHGPVKISKPGDTISVETHSGNGVYQFFSW
ncbi:MAG: hypothetical protein MJA83_11330, partial [Gammaproteobacteria bacterium]|nr:hypothetical protein [Gammaproteobacteria bacterium]